MSEEEATLTVGERMVEELEKIRQGIEWLKTTPLNLNMITVLVSDKVRVGKTKVRQVLEAFLEVMDELNQPSKV